MRKSIEATNDSSWSYFAVSLIGILSSQIKNTFVTNISDPLRDGWIVVRDSEDYNYCVSFHCLKCNK